MARPKDLLLKSLTVGKFFADHGQALELELMGDSVGMERPIAEPTINRPGLALAGFFRYFASKRVQVAGHAELSYLRSLPAEERASRIKALFEQRIPCLVIARGLPLPIGLLEFAAQSETPVFRTPLVTMKFINSATIALEDEFAPVASEHGSMVDIMGMGVLIRGSSGIGKSECVLGLIERGYSLVSDDITRFRNLEGRELIGNSKELTRFHMEVRGIGIINVAAIFGAGSVRPEKRLDLIVTRRLIGWDSTGIPTRSSASQPHMSPFPSDQAVISPDSSKSRPSIKSSGAWAMTRPRNSTTVSCAR